MKTVGNPRRLNVLFYNAHLFGDEATVRFVDLLSRIRSGNPILYKDVLRADLLAGRLNLQEDTDVVGLCEVWDDEISERIRERVEHEYPHSYRPRKKLVNGEEEDVFGSGLLLLSKVPFTRIGRTPFKLESGDDAWSQKGYARVALRIPGNRRVMLVWTHLQANANESARAIRAKQISQLRTTIDYSSRRPRFADLPVILMGDFNVKAEDRFGRYTDEYRQMLNALRMKDAFRVAHADPAAAPGFTSDADHNSLLPLFHDGCDCQRLDYVFFHDRKERLRLKACDLQELTTTSLNGNSPPVRHLSDHFGVRASFDLA